MNRHLNNGEQKCRPGHVKGRILEDEEKWRGKRRVNIVNVFFSHE
jgi:hypothetical protein